MSAMRQRLSRAPRSGVLARIGWSALGFVMMGIGFLSNAMFGSALWRAWGNGQTAFFVSAGIAAAAASALVTLGFLLDDTVERTKKQILANWLLWSWLCLCFRLSDRLGTENANWPAYLLFLIPVVFIFRSRQRMHSGGWLPRTIAEMRSGAPTHESTENKDSTRS